MKEKAILIFVIVGLPYILAYKLSFFGMGPAISVRYSRVNLCTYVTNMHQKSVCYNRVFVSFITLALKFHAYNEQK